MIVNILLMLLGLVLLVKGSDFFVKSASKIAKIFGVSEFIIGLTLVAVGTSVPELASSVVASLKQSSGIIIGNVVGSNVANIGLVIGIAAIIATIKTKKEMLQRDGYILLFSAILFVAFAFNGVISRIESLIFLLFYISYIFFLFEKKKKYKGKYQFKEFLDYFWNFRYVKRVKNLFKNKKKKREKREISKAVLTEFSILILGVLAIIFGAKIFINQAISFAIGFNVSETLIGITLVAIGTSFPELFVTISAVRKGFGTLAIGNIIGSNIANKFLILGTSGLILPLTVVKNTLLISGSFTVLMSVLLLIFIKSDWKLKKTEGIIFFILYLIFIFLMFKFL